MNTQGGTIGGGEVLEFWGNVGDLNLNSPYLNNTLIRMFNSIPFIKFIIMGLLVYIMIRVLMKLFNIKSFKTGKGILSELDYMEKVRKRDASILRYNKLIQITTKIVERSPISLSKTSKDYWTYNLERIDLRIPGGSRVYKATEFNAVVVAITACVIVIDLVLMIFANSAIGIILVVLTVVMAANMPMGVIRNMVKIKDEEINREFSDFYLMLHYTILSHSNTPLANVMKSYAKTTDSAEMKSLVDTCVHFIDTYGEYEACKYITMAYREVPMIGKLMRLIRQNSDGGDIEEELIGFRTELLNEKKYAIEKRTDKIVTRAKASFNILMPVLLQAILSAVGIYISDMGLINQFMAF